MARFVLPHGGRKKRGRAAGRLRDRVVTAAHLARGLPGAQSTRGSDGSRCDCRDHVPRPRCGGPAREPPLSGRPIRKNAAVTDSRASRSRTAGVWSGSGPSSKVRATARSVRRPRHTQRWREQVRAPRVGAPERGGGQQPCRRAHDARSRGGRLPARGPGWTIWRAACGRR